MIIYLKTRRRRPVRLGRYWEPDVQGRVPVGWCRDCGSEVWEEHPLCRRCRRK